MPVGSTSNEAALKQYESMSRGELIKEIEALRQEKSLLLLTQSVALRESEDRYRRMIETANEGVWIIDAKGVTSFVNAKMGIILGYRPDEMLGRHLLEFVDEEARGVMAGKLVNRRMGRKEQHDTQLRSKDGRLVWVQVCACPILDHDRNYTGALAMLSDITERKRALEALWKSEAHYRAMIDAFDGLIYICSPDYRIEFLNDRLKERTGHDATGELCYQALHGLGFVCPWCVNERVYAGECVRWEVRSPKDGRWYEVSNSPVYNADGSVSKQAMITDITDRKEAEGKLPR
jgi:PAS domain S-box-containing protein